MPDIDRLPLLYERYVNPDHGIKGRDRDSWSVRRFCQEDWVLNIRVQRVVQRGRRFEIAMFLTEDHEDFVRDAGVMGGLVLALSEAFDKTGAMHVHFVNEEPKIPECVRRVANNLGVSLKHDCEITDDEGRLLYARLTGLSAEAVKALEAKGADIVKACFVVNRGLWTKEQIELIALAAQDPIRILTGQLLSERRVQYINDLLLLRTAILAERLMTLISAVFACHGQVVRSEWVDEWRTRFTVSHPIELPTLADNVLTLDSNCPITAALIARDTKGYEVCGGADIVAAHGSASRVLLVTRDFDWLPNAVRNALLDEASRREVRIIQLNDTLGELDSEIDQRLARVSSTKLGAPERPD